MKKQLTVPNHIGFILDGNGRWATKRKLPRILGHKAGEEAVKKTLEAAEELGIKIISMYAFSTENWKRPKKEIEGIFNLLIDFVDKYSAEFCERQMKLRTMGDLSKFPENIRAAINKLSDETKNNTGLIVNLALNYGGRDEIVYAVNSLIAAGRKSVTAEDIQNNLYTKGLSDPDLIVRTSGEHRLSNFMLFQSSYSEFYFPKIYWPEFNKKWLIKCVKVYNKRNRRFGGLQKGN